MIRPFIALLLLMGIIFTITGRADLIIGSCGLARMNESNDQYLKGSFDRSLKGFLVLSAIKSGIAVLEGSEVGVGFNLQVGDAVQSIYDYVDVAWRTALAGGTILLLMRIVLQVIQSVDHWFLVGSLILYLIFFLSRWFLPLQTQSRRMLKECLLFVASLAVALYLILPLSIAGASYLSNRITRPLDEEAQAGFESLESDLTPRALSKRFFPSAQNEESLLSQLDLKAKLAISKQAVIKMGKWLDDITRDFATWTIKIIAGYLFDCIVFPLAFFIVVYLLTRVLLTYVLGISRRQSAQADLEEVFRKYYGGRLLPLSEPKPSTSPDKE
jgi:hypothetical protein